MTTLPVNAIPIIFDNRTTTAVWIQFLNGAFGPDQVGAGGSVALAGDTAYSLTELTSAVPGFPALGEVPNVFLNQFTNGRIYLNFGKTGLSGLGSGYQPSSNNSSDPNYNINYAYLELNVFGNQSNNMDLSDIDFFSMAIEASTWSNGKQVGALTYLDPGPAALGAGAKKLADLSGGEAAVRDGSDIVRIGGPGLAPGYHDWSAYFSFLAGRPASTMAGTYSGQGGTAGPTGKQSYSLKAQFGATSVVLAGEASIVGATTIEISYEALNAQTGAYGANPSYSVNGGAPTAGITNDVYGWIVADLLTALNCGLLASPTMVDGKALGDYGSSDMFKLAGKNLSLLFGGAQSNPDFYNGYAAEILKMSSDAYGFPFSDRIQQPLLYFPPAGQTGGVDYLKITILPIAYPA
jgi:Beta-1,3-glucanase